MPAETAPPNVTCMRAKVAALGLLTIVALTGCEPNLNNEYRDERIESATINEVALDGGSGSVTIESGGSDVRIRRHFTYKGDGKPAGRDRVDGALLRLNSDCGHGCSVDYTVTVPTAVKISGSQGSGAVTLRSVGSVAINVGSGAITIQRGKGDITARTGSGSVTIEDVAGSVTAHTDSGNIRITRTSGDVIADTGSGRIAVSDSGGTSVTARTSSGQVLVDLNRPQTVHAVTRSGSIKVTVPENARFDVRTDAGSGKVSVGIPITRGAAQELDLQTKSGNISVVATSGTQSPGASPGTSAGMNASAATGKSPAVSASPASPPVPTGP